MARAKAAAAPSDVMREVRARARTEGLLVAYETAVATCKNEKARPAERLDGANLICRIGGVFDGAGEDDAGEKPLASLTRAELVMRAEQARQVLAALDDPERDQGDGKAEVFD